MRFALAILLLIILGLLFSLRAQPPATEEARYLGIDPKVTYERGMFHTEAGVDFEAYFVARHINGITIYPPKLAQKLGTGDGKEWVLKIDAGAAEGFLRFSSQEKLDETAAVIASAMRELHDLQLMEFSAP